MGDEKKKLFMRDHKRNLWRHTRKTDEERNQASAKMVFDHTPLPPLPVRGYPSTVIWDDHHLLAYQYIKPDEKIQITPQN